MFSTAATVVAALGLTLVPSAYAGVTAAKSTTSVAACSKAPYKDLLFVSSYSQAASFCSSKYPPKTSYTTTTVTVTQGAAAQKLVTKKPTSSATKTPAPTCNKACTAWNSAAKQAASFVSTLCSCIETTPTITATVTQTVRPKAECRSQFQGQGSFKCSCYYTTECGTRFTDFKQIIGSGYAATQDDCGVMAGDGLGYYYNYNLVTGECTWADQFQSEASVSDPDYATGEFIEDAGPCRNGPTTDPFKAGCGCTYDQRCNTNFEGTTIGPSEETRFYAECFRKCDLNPSCVALYWAYAQCTLYSNVTAVVEEFNFASGAGIRTSCDNPCPAK